MFILQTFCGYIRVVYIFASPLPEFIKYAPPNVHRTIAEILNNIAKTGKYPDELITGILTPLQKPGKKKGPPENLRPIILLSTIRKILTICLLKRIWNKISPKIPIEQAAYQPGRSTTEQVHTIKLLIEKAITSNNFNIYIILLDMSKAFDTVNRKKLFDALEQYLDDDEIHLLSILTNNPKLKVKVNQEFSDIFNTLIGIMQGDCLSAILFIFYLACALEDKNSSTTNDILFKPKYADDITYASTNKELINNIKIEIPNKLLEYDLTVNKSKTEEYVIPKPPPPEIPPPSLETLYENKDNIIKWSELDWTITYNKATPINNNPDWKECKLLGSLLDTEKDFNRRKKLAIDAMKTSQYIFKSKLISTELKIRTFNAYVASIFLYNSETWTITKTQENQIDAFHRKQLRYAINYHWPRKISNKDLYQITNAEPWSKNIKRRRLNWLGHLMRLNENTPIRKALEEFLTPHNKPIGRPPTTWLHIVKKDLQTININLNLKNKQETLNTLITLTKERLVWRAVVDMLMKEDLR